MSSSLLLSVPYPHSTLYSHNNLTPVPRRVYNGSEHAHNTTCYKNLITASPCAVSKPVGQGLSLDLGLPSTTQTNKASLEGHRFPLSTTASKLYITCHQENVGNAQQNLHCSSVQSGSSSQVVSAQQVNVSDSLQSVTVE